jgi:hypothetical protein
VFCKAVALKRLCAVRGGVFKVRVAALAAVSALQYSAARKANEVCFFNWFADRRKFILKN